MDFKVLGRFLGLLRRSLSAPARSGQRKGPGCKINFIGFSFTKMSQNYCRFHLVCPGIKFGERNFFWAWYKLKLICVLYFHFVPSPEKVSLAKFYPWTNQVESTIARISHGKISSSHVISFVPQIYRGPLEAGESQRTLQRSERCIFDLEKFWVQAKFWL